MDLSRQESVNKLIIGLLIATLFIVGFNSLRLSSMGEFISIATASSSASASAGATGTATGATIASSSLEFMPKGVPAIYGKELGVSYDDVSPNDPEKADQTIRKLGIIDQEITLSGADKERYINILYKLNNGISCEYCCGARAIIFADGQPACGCAHSYAMRGLAKYLITEHGSEYTDEQILEEVGKWKALFFPGPMAAKAEILKTEGKEINFVNLASNKYRGIEQGKGQSSGGMIGGC